MQLCFLGTGTSAGIPLIGCHCEVCDSTNPKDKRLRSSVLISLDDKNIVIDTGPDFRTQMLRENIESLDAVLFTHEHRDHIAGLDDTRPFLFWSGKAMQIYCDHAVEKAIKRDFYYAFQDNPYPGSPQFNLNVIEANTSFNAVGVKIEALRIEHGKLSILGYKIGPLVYITDANEIPPETMEKIKGCEILVLNALRTQSHHSHYNLEEALAVSKEIGAERVYFTHISHQLGSHDEVSAMLPDHISIAYDGLRLEI